MLYFEKLLIRLRTLNIKTMKTFTLKTQLLAVALAAVLLTTSCASTTLIDSYPSGADLYLDGEAVGQTPYQMTDTKPMFSSTSLRIEKENYRTFYNTITRDEEADVGAIVGGLFIWIPFLWALKYKPTHFYKLTPLNSAESFDGLIEKTQEENK